MILALTLAAGLFEGVRVWKFVLTPLKLRHRVLFLVDMGVFAVIVSQLFFPDFGRMSTERGILSYVGIGFAVAGSVFASWSRIHLGKNWRTGWDGRIPSYLTTDGPYRIIRHPVYAGTWLFGFGFELALMNWLVLGVFLASWLLLSVARREEEALAQAFKRSWRRYARHTPRFIPGLYRICLFNPILR